MESVIKLHSSATSPYARKVRILLLETGLDSKVVAVNQAVTPMRPNLEVNSDNPIGKIPALHIDDTVSLYDSRVICEYLDSLHDGRKLFPVFGKDRWLALCRQSLGDGLLDAAILGRYEIALRPKENFWPEWLDGQMKKIERSLDAMETQSSSMKGIIDIGTISIACALGYLDFRYDKNNWRTTRPALDEWYQGMSRRPSMLATVAPNTDPLKD